MQNLERTTAVFLRGFFSLRLVWFCPKHYTAFSHQVKRENILKTVYIKNSLPSMHLHSSPSHNLTSFSFP